ncbi:MAG: DUF4190 domain-containing protein [Pirellula sp.]
MPIDSICSSCGKTLRVDDEFEGRQARCPVCQNVYVVTRTSTSAFASSALGTADTDYAETTYQNREPLQSPFQTSASVTPTPATPSPVSTRDSATAESYYVRTPNSATYGPSNKETVLAWIEQGRLDDTCYIRSAANADWIGLAQWRGQIVSTLSGQASSASVHANPRFEDRGRPAFEFGSAQPSANQSAGYLKTGGGLIVLVLGLLSWVLCMTIIGGPICSIIAIVLGIKELRYIREGKSDPSEKVLTIVGLSLAILCLVMTIGIVLLAIIGALLDA